MEEPWKMADDELIVRMAEAVWRHRYRSYPIRESWAWKEIIEDMTVALEVVDEEYDEVCDYVPTIEEYLGITPEALKQLLLPNHRRDDRNDPT